MMDYEVFREVVSERIKDFLPPIFSSYKVKINTVRKVNEEKEALIMMPGKIRWNLRLAQYLSG